MDDEHSRRGTSRKQRRGRKSELRRKGTSRVQVDAGFFTQWRWVAATACQARAGHGEKFLREQKIGRLSKENCITRRRFR